METRNRLFFSEFFHNLSGDVLEITPTPGSNPSLKNGDKIFYYYWEEEELLAGRGLEKYFDGQSVLEDPNNPNLGNGLVQLPPGQYNLIANPLDMTLNMVNWSALSPWAIAFVKDLAFAKCKYIQGSKWRKIQKTMAGGEMNYEITFDYNSILSEASTEEQNIIEALKKDLDELNISTLMENQAKTVQSTREINKNQPRLWKFM